MILVDVNLLVYAYNSGSDQHAGAQAWLERELSSSTAVGLPWHTLLGFLRLSTNARVFATPLSTAEAWRRVTTLLSIDGVWAPQPTTKHAEVLGALLVQPSVHGNLVSDAHLAALAIEHGLTLCSTDGDFARFKGLRWRNPLA